jgi:hypothetical protein
MRSFEEVSNYFVYHPPTDEQRELYERLNAMWLSVAELLWELVPPYNQGSPDKTVMFRQLSDMRMQANLAVACFIPPVNSPPASSSQASDPASESPGQTPV